MCLVSIIANAFKNGRINLDNFSLREGLSFWPLRARFSVASRDEASVRLGRAAMGYDGAASRSALPTWAHPSGSLSARGGNAIALSNDRHVTECDRRHKMKLSTNNIPPESTENRIQRIWLKDQKLNEDYFFGCLIPW